MKKTINLFAALIILLLMILQTIVLADDMPDYYETQYPDYYAAMYEAYDRGYIYVYGDYYGKTFKDSEFPNKSQFAYEAISSLWQAFSISTDIPEVRNTIDLNRDTWHISDYNCLVYDYDELEDAIEKKFNGSFGIWDLINEMYPPMYLGTDNAGYIYFTSYGRGQGDYGAYIVVDKIKDLTDTTAYCAWHVENDYTDVEYPSPEMYAILERDSINSKEFISYKYLGVDPLSDNELASYSFNYISDEKITVILDGVEVVFDQLPIIHNDRTLVPLRAIFEALGATVSWDDKTQTVTAVRGNTTVKLTIGAYEFYKNGETISLDVPGMIINDRTLVPIRAISESFNCFVSWSGYNKTVYISQKTDNSSSLEMFKYNPQIEKAIEIVNNANGGTVSDSDLQYLFDCVGIANVKDYFNNISVYDVSISDKSAMDFWFYVNDANFSDRLEAYILAIEQSYGNRHESPMDSDISWSFGESGYNVFLTYDTAEHRLHISWSNDYFFNRIYYQQNK